MIHEQTFRALLLALFGGYVAGGFPAQIGVHPAWGAVVACAVAVAALLIAPHASEVSMDFIVDKDLVVVEEDEIEEVSP